MNNLIKNIKEARFIWVCGNGGSAATAEHLATDLVKKDYRAIALSSNTSLITMIANDYGYAKIYSKQLEVYGNSQDLLITISCSGTSANVAEATNRAIRMNMKLYKFEVFQDDRDYQALEDKHLIFAHNLIKNL